MCRFGGRSIETQNEISAEVTSHLSLQGYAEKSVQCHDDIAVQLTSQLPCGAVSEF